MSGRAVCFISQQRQQTCITTQQPDTRRRHRNNEAWAKNITSRNATRRIPTESVASENVSKTSQQRSTSKNDRARKRNEQNPDKNYNEQKQGKQERGQVPQTELRQTAGSKFPYGLGVKVPPRQYCKRAFRGPGAATCQAFYHAWREGEKNPSALVASGVGEAPTSRRRRKSGPRNSAL